jgi:hypothetical protein
MPVITYDTPIIDRKSRLAMFGVAFYVVFTVGLTFMVSERNGGTITAYHLAYIPVVLLLPLAKTLYTVRQIQKLERRSLLTPPAADQLFKAALTQLSVGYATPVLLLPVFLQ